MLNSRYVGTISLHFANLSIIFLIILPSLKFDKYKADCKIRVVFFL